MHVITDLDMGGAEVMLAKLIGATDRSRFNPSVLSLKRKGVIADRIERSGVPIFELNLNHPFSGLQASLKLKKILTQLRPELLQGWMYHGNLAASMMYFLNIGHPSVIWNIRHSLNAFDQEKIFMRLLICAGAFFSKSPAAIVYNAHISLKQHEAIGYFPHNSRVIPNGFDTERFRPNLRIRRQLRLRLGVSENGILIGLIARYHPMKDHFNFLQAAALMAKERPDVRFLIVGRGVDEPSSGLIQTIEGLGLTHKVICLGEQKNMAAFYAALDITSLSSAYGEAFPNVIGEAMASGVPCVVTDVGDCRRLVGNTGITVPVKNPRALKRGWDRLLGMKPAEKNRLGLAARKEIIENFTISRVCSQYEDLYESVMPPTPPNIH